MKMKHNGKNTLDEMQDQKMLKMEEYGYWILFWGLALAVVIQLLLGGSIRQVAGELIVLLLGGIYVLATSMKNGLWTRNAAPTRKGMLQPDCGRFPKRNGNDGSAAQSTA